MSTIQIPGDDISGAGASPLSSSAIARLVRQLAWVDGADCSDAERVELLGALERVKSACAAAQAKVTVAFADSQERVADAYARVAKCAADGGDFEAWRQARDETRRASASASASASATATASPSPAGRRRSRGCSGVAAQVGLARRVSPAQGEGLLGLARALTVMPGTWGLLADGTLSETRARIVARETAILDDADRELVDEQLLGRYGDQLGGWGDRQLAAQVSALAYRVDGLSVLRRMEKAPAERRVTVRPAADGMVWLTALLPLVHGIAVHASLSAAAGTAKSLGDERGKGQVMADALVARVLGQPPAATATVIATDGATGIADGATRSAGLDLPVGSGESRSPASTLSPFAHPHTLTATSTGTGGTGTDRLAVAPVPAPVPVEVQLVITDRSLLRGDSTPAQIPGYGTVPVEWARHYLRSGIPPGTAPSGTESSGGEVSDRARVWLRRLYTHPADGALVAMDSARRLFDGGMRAFLIARDRICRTPWCDAPVRHIDHIRPWADGGATTADNGQGLCVKCNLTKEQPGWRHELVFAPVCPPAGGGQTARRTHRRHVVAITTPTGHRHHSQAPETIPGDTDHSRLERHLEDLLRKAS